MKILNFIEKKTKQFLINNSLNYDLMIIGSGFASYVISKKLHKYKKILILEKGNFKSNNSIKKFHNTGFIHLKNNTYDEIFGGTSNLWSGNLCEYSNIEFIDRNTNKCAWPIMKAIQFYYRESWKIFGVYFRSKTKFININPNLISRKIVTQYFPTRVGSKFRKLNIDIIINADVKYLGEKKKPFIIIDEERYFFKKIIISNGGIGSIKIINDSIKKRHLKIKIDSDFVGKGYMNHPKFRIKKFLIPKINDGIVNSYSRNCFSFYGISLKNRIQKTKALSNTYARFHPKFFQENKWEFIIAQYIFSNKKKFLQNLIKLKLNSSFFKPIYKNPKINFKISFIKVFLNLNIYFYFFFFMGLVKLKVKYYDLEYFFELTCNNENYIKFNNNYLESKINIFKKDIETFDLLHFELIKHFNRHHTINKKLYSIKLNDVNFVDASHHIGGLNYLNFTDQGFIDKNCKINNSNNIHICSSSVFPTAGSGNPTLTIAALALKLSNFLRK